MMVISDYTRHLNSFKHNVITEWDSLIYFPVEFIQLDQKTTITNNVAHNLPMWTAMTQLNTERKKIHKRLMILCMYM